MWRQYSGFCLESQIQIGRELGSLVLDPVVQISPISVRNSDQLMMEQGNLETTSRHMKDQKAIRYSKHGLTKRKSCLTNLMNFGAEVTE